MGARGGFPGQLLLGLTVATAAAGCKPDLGAPPSLVTAPRLLAIRGTPAEASPGAMVTYDALAVDVTGTVASPPIDWAQCLLPNPPANGNAVSNGCLGIPDDAGPSATFAATLASDACMLFGPETPTPMKGQPATRPADADTTGGYYQPIRAAWTPDAGAGVLAFAQERILCRLANAPIGAAGQYASDYTPNANPTLEDLVLDPAGAATALYAAGTTAPPPANVSPGQEVTLQADWSDDTAETFLVWDVVSKTLVMQRESLRLSWFATAGAFAHDATGRTSSETEAFTQNIWTAPADPGPVYLWTVLGDSRGGVDFAAVEIDVTP